MEVEGVEDVNYSNIVKEQNSTEEEIDAKYTYPTSWQE